MLLVIGIILAIVLPLTLGGGGGDGPTPVPPAPPRPPPVEPDPFMYQEFNPFYLDPDVQIKRSTFEATFPLKFNKTALAEDKLVARTKRVLPASVRAFMEKEKAASEGSSYKPMNPRFLPNNDNNTWSSNINLNVQMNNNDQVRFLVTDADVSANQSAKHQVNSNLFPRPPLEIESRLKEVGFVHNATGSFSFNISDIYT